MGGVTGWDIGCRTMEFYVNNLAKEGGGHEGRESGRAVDTLRAKENPAGLNLRGRKRGFSGLLYPFPARALRSNRKVKSKHKAR